MATNYADTVNAFYLAYYGRPADPAGLAFWTQALQKNNGDFGAITSAFASSAEATARFGSESVADRVSDIYQQLFNRAPDQAGLNYWVGAIQSGRMSMASAAIEIMHGAQSTDAQISTVREQAAAQFTTAVAASGVAYDGDAAIQAARVLISAITATSKPADIDALVSASTSLVQTAHDNPAVIKALANGGDLSALLSTAGGKADPVGTVQALATLGKAALTDTTGLNTLLQGGGVAGLLNALPAGTSLHDVASAVQQGGLSAGTAVANPPPPADTTPPAALKLQLVADSGASATDHITNDGHVQVSGIEAGATWEYSFDGKTWTAGPAANANGVATLATSTDGANTLQVRSHDAAGNLSDTSTLQYTLKTSYAVTEAFKGPDGNALAADATLSVNSPNYVVYTYGAKAAVASIFQVSDTGADGSWVTTSDAAQLKDGLHYIRYVFTDAAGNVANANALKLMVDTVKPAAPVVTLVNDTGASATDHITSDGHVQVGGIEAGGGWEYSFDGKSWTAGAAADAKGALVALPASTDGDYTLQVRSHDAAGNLSDTSTLQYTLKTSYAVTEAFKGPDGNALAADATLSVNSPNYVVYTYGAKAAVASIFQVSDTGVDGSWVTTSDAAQLKDGLHYIRYVFTDAAGNVANANALKLMVDTVAPAAPTVALASDTGASATDGITANSQFKVSGIEAGATWDFSFDGTNWIRGATPDATGSASGYFAQGEQTVQVRVHDAAGNIGTASLHATVDFTAPAAGLAFDHIVGEAAGSTTATHNQADVVFSYTGTVVAGDTIEYETAANNQWVKLDASALDANARTITLHGLDLSTADPYVQVRVTDLAGNANFTHVSIDGPYTSYTVQGVTDAGLQLTSNQTAHIYLTDGSNPSVQVRSSDASGDAVAFTPVTIGVQSSGVQGVLGLGTGPDGHTSNDATTYGVGSTGNDTLTGKYVWGYGGDDVLNVTASAAYNSGYVVGGAGADQIHTETASTQLVYTGALDSFIAADDTAAHGFDTVYVSTDASASFTEQFRFENISLSGGYQTVTGTGYTGTETGTELLAKLNTALGHTIQLNGTVQEGFVDFGLGTDGKDVGFLIVDMNGNGAVDASDYVVKIVGNVDHSSISMTMSGIVQFNAGPAGH